MCRVETDKYGDPIPCETITLDGGGLSGGSGVSFGDSSGGSSNIVIDGFGETSGDASAEVGGGDSNTREAKDPVDPVGGKTCCNMGDSPPDSGLGSINIGGSTDTSDSTNTSAVGGCTFERKYDLEGQVVGGTFSQGCFGDKGTERTKNESIENIDSCPECPKPSDGVVGILPPKGSATEVPDDGDCNTSKEDLKKVFPNMTDANAELLASVINEKGKDFGLDTAEKLQHFLAQAGHETGGFNTLNVTENLNYTTATRISEMWDKFTTDIIANPTKLNADLYTKNAEKLANAAYCCKYGNGDESSGDGWKYRGRGIFQLTWKDNYQAFKTFYNNNYDPDIDPVAEPEIIANNKDLAILSGLWYYKIRVLDKITIDSITSVDKVTKPINAAKVGIKDRKELFQKAKDSINCL